jgi:hypothetical protein
MPNTGIPLGEWSGSNATNQLRETIEKLSQQSERQTRTMVRLTKAIFGLTVLMIVIGSVQIWIALYPHL